MRLRGLDKGREREEHERAYIGGAGAEAEAERAGILRLSGRPGPAVKVDAASLVAKWGIPAATVIYCYVSGLVPVVNAEAFLVFISAAALSRSQLLLVAILATVGQMSAKSTMYFIARSSFRRPPRKYAETFDRTREKLERWRHGTAAFMFISSSTGFPPFYVVSILSGMMRINFLTFLVFGLAGRFIRFGLMVLFPHLIKELL